MKKHIIGLVVNPDWGNRILDMADNYHVWVVDTPKNKEAAEEYWKNNPSYSTLKGVTTFIFNPKDTPEKTCENILNSINEHHDKNYDDTGNEIPAWNEIRIIGAECSKELKNELAKYGFSKFEKNEFGFIGYK